MATDTDTAAASLLRRLNAQPGAWGSRIPLVCWPLLASLIVQAHVLGHGFLFDDFVHLYSVSNLPFLDAIRVPMGGHLLHSFTAVVWVLKALAGLNPFVFLLFGLLLHLLSVGLLFGIVARLTRSESLAAFGATLWGMNPFVAGTLGWISVHGQAYATFAILWVVLDIVRCSQSPGLVRPGLLWRQALLLMVAATSFGAGLTSVVVLPLVVALWNPVPAQRTRLLLVYSAVAFAAIALYVLTMQQQGEAQDNLADKVEVITQSLFILPVIGRAFAELLAIGSSGLVGGPLVIGKIAVVPQESLSLVSGLVALLFVLPLLLWGCVASSSAERRRVFALLLLPCAAYAIIAIARSGGLLVIHAESPRYHYFSPALLAVVLCLLLSKIAERLPARARAYGRISYFVWLALALVPFALGPAPASKQANLDRQNRQFQQSSTALEKALQRQAGNDAIYIRNRPFSVFVWGYTPEHFPGLAGLFVISYPDNSFDGKAVYFLEESKELVEMAQAQEGTRIAELLIHRPQQKKP